MAIFSWYTLGVVTQRWICSLFLCLGAGVLHVLARREAMDLQQLFFGQFVGRGLLSWLWVFLGLMQQSDRDDEDED